jgi:hypothetical protein
VNNGVHGCTDSSGKNELGNGHSANGPLQKKAEKERRWACADSDYDFTSIICDKNISFAQAITQSPIKTQSHC